MFPRLQQFAIYILRAAFGGFGTLRRIYMMQNLPSKHLVHKIHAWTIPCVTIKIDASSLSCVDYISLRLFALTWLMPFNCVNLLRNFYDYLSTLRVKVDLRARKHSRRSNGFNLTHTCTRRYLWTMVWLYPRNFARLALPDEGFGRTFDFYGNLGEGKDSDEWWEFVWIKINGKKFSADDAPSRYELAGHKIKRIRLLNTLLPSKSHSFPKWINTSC